MIIRNQMDLYGSVTLRVYKWNQTDPNGSIWFHFVHSQSWNNLNLQYKLWVPGVEMPFNRDSTAKYMSNWAFLPFIDSYTGIKVLSPGDGFQSWGFHLEQEPLLGFLLRRQTFQFHGLPLTLTVYKMEPNGPVRVHLVPFVHCQSYRLVWVN